MKASRVPAHIYSESITLRIESRTKGRKYDIFRENLAKQYLIRRCDIRHPKQRDIRRFKASYIPMTAKGLEEYISEYAERLDMEDDYNIEEIESMRADAQHTLKKGNPVGFFQKLSSEIYECHGIQYIVERLD